MLALLGRKGAEEEAIIEGVNGGNTVEACGKSKVKDCVWVYFWCERCPPSNIGGLNGDFIVS